jgi:hypothetical protein
LNMLKQPMCPSANMKLVKRLIPLKSEWEKHSNVKKRCGDWRIRASSIWRLEFCPQSLVNHWPHKKNIAMWEAVPVVSLYHFIYTSQLTRGIPA